MLIFSGLLGYFGNLLGSSKHKKHNYLLWTILALKLAAMGTKNLHV